VGSALGSTCEGGARDMTSWIVKQRLKKKNMTVRPEKGGLI
jgi:hypothetical protein